jgi:hypothetical protein
MGSMKEPIPTADPLVIAIEKRAYEARVPMTGILKDAKVGRASWWRWRQGRPAQLTKVRAVEATLNARLAK